MAERPNSTLQSKSEACEFNKKACLDNKYIIALSYWASLDDTLLADVNEERQTMDAIFYNLKTTSQPISRWYYGHFYRSWYSSIDGVLFKMLNIMEFSEIM